MKIDLAILNLLDGMPRPVPVAVVIAQLPQFYAGRVTQDAASEALERLQATGDIDAVSKRYTGLLYFITPSGKAAIA
jgi:hypothetical protein